LLPSDEREESHDACAFYRDRELTLHLYAHAGALPGHDTPMRIKKLLEKFRILVVDVFEFLCIVFLHPVRDRESEALVR